jgi:hypothetical protein
MRLAEIKGNAAKDIAALEAKLTKMVARVAESSATAEKHFQDFCTKIYGDMAPLRETFECSIQSLGGICSLSPARILWLKTTFVG